MRLFKTKQVEIAYKVEELNLTGLPPITSEGELIQFIDGVLPKADPDFKDQLVEHYMEHKHIDRNEYAKVLLAEILEKYRK